MATYAGLDRPKSKAYFRVWTGVFFLGALGLVSLLYFSTKKVEYTWRWNRVPQYFLYEEKTEIRAETEGEIVQITPLGQESRVLIRGADGEENHDVPVSSLLLAEGDYVYPGDVLGSFSRHKAGILVEGLLLTLEVSALAIVLGIDWASSRSCSALARRRTPSLSGSVPSAARPASMQAVMVSRSRSR